jgi:hypothetical protein
MGISASNIHTLSSQSQPPNSPSPSSLQSPSPNYIDLSGSRLYGADNVCCFQIVANVDGKKLNNEFKVVDNPDSKKFNKTKCYEITDSNNIMTTRIRCLSDAVATAYNFYNQGTSLSNEKRNQSEVYHEILIQLINDISGLGICNQTSLILSNPYFPETIKTHQEFENHLNILSITLEKLGCIQNTSSSTIKWYVWIIIAFVGIVILGLVAWKFSSQKTDAQSS